jgi:hypothetical protein
MDDGDIRIGSAERAEALAALAEHHAAGRLDANDYEDRRGKATDALVRRELIALFVDLPEPRPHLAPAAGPVGAVGSGASGVPQTSVPARHVSRPPLQSKVARTMVSLSPFIGIGAFFLTKSWLAFLLIPVIAILARALDN